MVTYPTPTGGDEYAVIGLGRGNTILPKNATSSSRIFSNILNDDLQGSTVWVGPRAILAETAAARANRMSATVLRHNSTGWRSRLYYIHITDIKVGSGEVADGEEVPAVGIMTTTIPFTILKPALFNHLGQELSAVASPVSHSGSNTRSLRQLCYPSGTELPAITLVFAAPGKEAAEMKLRPEHYSYKKSNDGVACLSILPSPWSFSGVPVSVIGSMVQAGRLMTYNLKDNTLTFDVAASASSN